MDVHPVRPSRRDSTPAAYSVARDALAPSRNCDRRESSFPACRRVEDQEADSVGRAHVCRSSWDDLIHIPSIVHHLLDPLSASQLDPPDGRVRRAPPSSYPRFCHSWSRAVVLVRQKTSAWPPSEGVACDREAGRGHGGGRVRRGGLPHRRFGREV